MHGVVQAVIGISAYNVRPSHLDLLMNFL